MQVGKDMPDQTAEGRSAQAITARIMEERPNMPAPELEQLQVLCVGIGRRVKDRFLTKSTVPDSKFLSSFDLSIG